ncbi:MULTISPECIES: hypothetical protein [Pseudonocardia]|uniref:Uncharacterized protein n=2 Tax=Pseudonocardia TaxID=1847 RepID=A0A1Y2ML50_PSEAH|nr:MULTISPECIES: hypothetical protein [Pseudonocardia]OSY36016.1 hypothetical protein BG845_05698 [Pseudonocardia autotrophica]TDN65648.1 hypothetical protein C8E95_7157 [Pseudonocardia autotrophica]BBG05798.1 hypothetical protein Pdca_70070 [Pseudonocardia autotrophica]GEC27052.1 hypothetical protein PSA01_40810 [Pseudonocardia saturnea]
MTVHDPTTEPAQDPAALGEFIPDRVTVHRCPCSTRSAVLHPADRAGRIMADPDWSEHQSVTCGQCGRYGRLDPDDPENATVVVLGRAPLPAGCRECGAEHGEPCREPFCPGQDVLDPHPGLDHPADGEPAVYQAAALLGDVPSTTRIWRHWASRLLDPSSGRRGREAARSAVEATREARRLRRGLRRGPVTVATAAEADHGDVCELLEFLGGRGGVRDQQEAVFALRVVQGWGDSMAAELLDAAAVWRAGGRAPF